MDTAAVKLKALRESASPKLSVRKAAAGAGLAPSTYSAYEDQKRFKKRYIPVELAHALVPVFVDHGIDRETLLELAGISPDAVARDTSPPPKIHHVTMQVALPSEPALARMFEGLLRPLDLSRPVAETAQILAQRLPIGFAQLQDLMPIPSLGSTLDDDADLPDYATTHRGSPRARNT